MARDKKTSAKTSRASDAVDSGAQSSTPSNQPNPVWFKPVMFGFMLLGLAWIIVFYVSGALYPVASLGQLNLLVGFGIMFIGFIMTTRWR